jgi:hypothetical protein
MEDADAIVIEALLDDVLDESIVRDAPRSGCSRPTNQAPRPASGSRWSSPRSTGSTFG